MSTLATFLRFSSDYETISFAKSVLLHHPLLISFTMPLKQRVSDDRKSILCFHFKTYLKMAHRIEILPNSRTAPYSEEHNLSDEFPLLRTKIHQNPYPYTIELVLLTLFNPFLSIYGWISSRRIKNALQNNSKFEAIQLSLNLYLYLVASVLATVAFYSSAIGVIFLLST